MSLLLHSLPVAIVVAGWNASTYGAYLVNKAWIEALVAVGEKRNLHLFCSAKDYDSVLARFANEPRVEVYRLNDLPAKVKSADYLVIHTFGIRPALLAFVRDACSFNECPVCTFIQSFSYHEVIAMMTNNLLAGRIGVDSLLCPTRSAKRAVELLIEHLAQCPELAGRARMKDDIFIIPHGIETSRYMNIPDKRICRETLGLPVGATIIGSVGRISYFDKIDYACLLKAFAEFQHRSADGRNAILLIAGDNKHSHLGRLYAHAQELGIEQSLRVIPNFSEEQRLTIYGAMDVFISLANSPQEAFGLTILEAMASKAPIVATAWDGYRDLIAHGENGILVDARFGGDLHAVEEISTILPWQETHEMLAKCVFVDSHEVCSAIERVLYEPRLKESLISNASRRVADFDWSRVIKTMENHWYSLYEKKGRGEKARALWFGYDYAKIFAGYSSETTNRPLENRVESCFEDLEPTK